MSYVGKMDVIDLIIETLREHEKALNEIVSTLDALLNKDENSKSIRSNNSDERTSLESWR